MKRGEQQKVERCERKRNVKSDVYDRHWTPDWK